MKAFLLAAGFGERLRPLTLDRPKPLVPVCGIPSILYALSLLDAAGITEIVCNIHYRADDVVRFFTENDFFGFDVTFSREETILGTGGGLMRCREFLSDGPFVMINSDIVTDIPLERYIAGFPGPWEEGRVILSPPAAGCPATVSVNGDRVVDFRDFLGTGAPPSYDYTGIAVLTPAVFPFLEKGFSSVVYTGFTSLASRGTLRYVEWKGTWLDIGSVGSLRESEKLLMEGGGELPARVRERTGFRGYLQALPPEGFPPEGSPPAGFRP